MNVRFLWTFECSRKRRVNKTITKIAMIQDGSYAYVFRNDNLKCSFVNFLSIFSLFQCSYIARFTAQKMKFSIKDFFSKCDQIRRKLQIWSHLQKKSLMENVIFCAVIWMRYRSFYFIWSIRSTWIHHVMPQRRYLYSSNLCLK